MDETTKERQIQNWVRKAQAGDRAAFGCLIEHFGRTVMQVARSIVGNAVDGDDVAQESFLRFYGSIDRVDPSRPLEPWLVRLTVNAARNHVSRHPGRRESSLDEAVLARRSGSPGPAGEMHRGDLRAALTEAMRTLSEREREVLILRDMQDLEVSTIAEALEISPITVRRLSSKGRSKVHRWFEGNRPELLSEFGKSGPVGEQSEGSSR